MDHADHVALIRGGVEGGAAHRWLELGAGEGAFTLALVDLLGDDGEVTALDHDAGALRRLEADVARRSPEVPVHIVVADFTQPLPVEASSVDGVLMANSLHFVRDKEAVLHAGMAALKPGGRFVLVEYGADRGNPWAPWPVSFARWVELAERVGLRETRKLGEVPSRFLGSIYAAVSFKP